MENLEEKIAQANEGNREAQFLVGKAYEEGNGIAQDYNEAIKYYEMAAKSGDIVAELNAAQIKNLNVKIKVTFSIRGYKNGRMVNDSKKFVVSCGESRAIPSYNVDEAFTIDKYFLKHIVIKRTKNGVDSFFDLVKGQRYEINEKGSALEYQYSFEIVFATRAEILRDLREERFIVELDHYELEKEIYFKCHSVDLNLNPYAPDIAKRYWEAKKEILKENHNIEWDTPIEMAEGNYDPCKIEGACEIDQEYWWTLI